MRRWPGGLRGFTLLEVVLATGLMVVLMGGVHLFYSTALRTCAEGRALSRNVRLAWAALDMMARDIRSASGFVSGYGMGLVGDAHSMTLHTVRLPSRELFAKRKIQDKPLAGECDIVKVQYYVATDEEETVEDEQGEEQPLVYGLVRWEQQTLNQLVMIDLDEDQFDVELWAGEIKYVGFRYFDGVEWVTTWHGGGGNSLPQAVKVTVGFVPVTEEELAAEEEIAESEMVGEQVEYEVAPVPDRYSMVVRVAQADAFLGSRLVRARQVMGNLRGR